MTRVELSVVVGFKDWGVERLSVSLQSIQSATRNISSEVIVSDYGSANGPALRSLVEGAGAKYEYTQTNGLWSRSRALNAGFAKSNGNLLVSTDADMLFGQRTFEFLLEQAADDPEQAFILQCRDLPEGFGADRFSDGVIDWELLERVALLRPRWGMGGLMAVNRETFRELRGFDERMEIYGGEDIDFANRVRRSGSRLRWLQDEQARMFHMWHPPSRQEADRTSEGRDAIAFNREIVLHDKSIVRNVPGWLYPLKGPEDAPLVSIVICTRNRASLLVESVYSALAQSVDDIEVIVIDDGSSDDTERRLAAICDDRIRYFRNPGRGIPVARNFATTVSRGVYTAVHDDDDIMLPNALAHGLRAIAVDDDDAPVGAYGGWINFSNDDGSMRGEPGADFSIEGLVYKGRVLTHGTLLVRTDVLRSIGYDTSLRTGSDFNMMLRLVRSGFRLVHSGEYHMLRRQHSAQVTQTDSGVQKASARSTVEMVQSTSSEDEITTMRRVAQALDYRPLERDPATLRERYERFLPDHLGKRTVVARWTHVGPREASGSTGIVGYVTDGKGEWRLEVIPGASWQQVAELRSAGAELQFFPFDVRLESAQRRLCEATVLVSASASDKAFLIADDEAANVNPRGAGARKIVVEGVGCTERLIFWPFDGYEAALRAAVELEAGSKSVRVLARDLGATA